MSRTKQPKPRTLSSMRLVAIGTLTVALFTLGLILLLRLVAIGIGHSVKEQISLTIELNDEDQLQSSQLAQLQANVRTLKGVRAVDFISKDSAVRELARELGEDPTEVLGYNPLSSVLRLSLHSDYVHPDSLSVLAVQLADLGLSAKPNYREDLLSSVEDNMGYVEWVLWILLGLEIVLSYIQISNTTRLMIYADRLKIRTLCLVGASSWFIRRPYVGRGVADALIALVVALCLLGGLTYSVSTMFGISLVHLLQPEHLALSVGILLAVAILSCALTASGAARRYIGMDAGKIHLI